MPCNAAPTTQVMLIEDKPGNANLIRAHLFDEQNVEIRVQAKGDREKVAKRPGKG